MKRAEGFVIGPCFFHLEVSSGEVDDIDAGFYVLGYGHDWD